MSEWLRQWQGIGQFKAIQSGIFKLYTSQADNKLTRIFYLGWISRFWLIAWLCDPWGQDESDILVEFIKISFLIWNFQIHFFFWGKLYIVREAYTRIVKDLSEYFGEIMRSWLNYYIFSNENKVGKTKKKNASIVLIWLLTTFGIICPLLAYFFFQVATKFKKVFYNPGIERKSLNNLVLLM